MVLEQVANFVTDCGQRTVLNFNQPVAPKCVNAVITERYFDAITLVRIMQFQLAVE